MRAPGSLAGRLTWAAVILVGIALIVAGTGIGLALHRFVRGQIDQRLDAEIASLHAVLEPSGDGISLSRRLDGPPFDRPGSGWYWQVTGAGQPLTSLSLAGRLLETKGPRGRPGDYFSMRPMPADGSGPRGEPLLMRSAVLPVGRNLVTITVSAPRQAALGPLSEAMMPLALSMAVLGLCLAAAIYLQVRLGLKPLGRLRQDIAAIRAGRLEKLPGGQPRELSPLADEVNALLDQNAAGLERARRNVANLAHGLKTPLATLATALQGRGDSRDLLFEVERMERQIRHHLGRARAAALDGPARVRTDLAASVEDLALVFRRIHAERGLAFTADIPAGTLVACERQDLDELLGNVLDNAFKWARHAVRLTAAQQDGRVVVTVDDDGPGIAADAMPEALRPGKRLDETVPGDGFGLAITRELAELYSGGVALDRALLGGLRVAVTLPGAIG